MNKQKNNKQAASSIVAWALSLLFVSGVAFASAFGIAGSRAPLVSAFATTTSASPSPGDWSSEPSPGLLDALGGPQYKGDLSTGFKTGSLTPFADSHYYTLSTSGTNPSAYGIMINANYDVDVSIYYFDSDASHPFIVSQNGVQFLPTFPNRTAFILLSSSAFLAPTFSYGISASELTNFQSDYDYIKYDYSQKSLTFESYTATANNLVLSPSSTISVNPSDLDPTDTWGWQEVNNMTYPFNCIAQVSKTCFHSNNLYSATATAFRVRPNVFLTNGHCVFDHNHYAFADSPVARVGRSGSTWSSQLTVRYLYLPFEYIYSPNPFWHDAAIWVTTGDSATDYLGVDSTSGPTLTTSDCVSLAGYPQPGLYYSYHQQFSSDYICENRSTENRIITYMFSSEDDRYSGSSGGPVFFDGKVVGINNGFLTTAPEGVFSHREEHFVLFDQALQNTLLTAILS